MTVEESDQILNETTHHGRIEVAIEGIGTKSLYFTGKPLRTIASIAASFLRSRKNPVRKTNKVNIISDGN